MCLPGVDFGTWRWGGGRQENPETRHADLSPPPEPGTTLPEGDASWGPACPPGGERQPLGPLSQLYSPSAPARGAPSSRRSSPAALLPGPARKPARAARLPATRSLAGLRALRSSPSACPAPAPASQLRKTNPGAARKGRSGRRGEGGRRPGPGCLPLPPPTPQQVAPQRAARALALPPSLSRSLARSVPVTWAGSRTVPRGRAPGALRLESKWH